jgi:hypothetical protein
MTDILAVHATFFLNHHLAGGTHYWNLYCTIRLDFLTAYRTTEPQIFGICPNELFSRCLSPFDHNAFNLSLQHLITDRHLSHRFCVGHSDWFDLLWFDLLWFDLLWFDLLWFDLLCADILQTFRPPTNHFSNLPGHCIFF